MKSCSSTGNLDTVYRLSCDLEQDARTAAACVVRHGLGSAILFYSGHLFQKLNPSPHL